MKYKMEELLPIVAELAEKYTSKESTSISFERARQLMEAVIYCIELCETEDTELDNRNRPTCRWKISAMEAYRGGYELLLRKVKKTKAVYNEMIASFCTYSNENYYDTVTKAIPGFFRYYDTRFAPQETIITMDYPTICPITECSGINAIEKYVEYISYEQRFMMALPDEYIYEVLFRYQPDYRKQFYNICSIVLRHILGCLLIERKPGLSGSKQDYIVLKQMIEANEKEVLEKRLKGLLHMLIANKYGGNKRLENYLAGDIDDFVECLINGRKYNYLNRVLVL